MSLNNKTKIIGLTGNIASGKSTVAQILASYGVPVIDADQLLKELFVKNSPVYSKVLQHFGTQIQSSDGNIDRKKLRELVFQSNDKRKELESITHPAIQQLSEERFQHLSKQNPIFIIYEATLLVETGRYKDFDGLLLVISSHSNQLLHLMKRDPTLTREAALQMITVQMPAESKKSYAQWIIHNDSTLESLESEVKRWFLDMSQSFQKHP